MQNFLLWTLIFELGKRNDPPPPLDAWAFVELAVGGLLLGIAWRAFRWDVGGSLNMPSDHEKILGQTQQF